MGDSREFSVILPDDMAQAVEERICSGAYASVSDMVRESVQAQLERDSAVERWLTDEVVRSYDEHKANPLAAVPADQVMARIHTTW